LTFGEGVIGFGHGRSSWVEGEVERRVFCPVSVLGG
jgi:hypothetical protein